MEIELDIRPILDRTVKDISKRVAHLDMKNTNNAEFHNTQMSSLVTTTNGDYVLTIILFTHDTVMYDIAVNMLRGKTPTQEEAAACVMEYFNVLCGHIVTTVNKTLPASARFCMPYLMKGEFSPTSEAEVKREEQCFLCSSGPVRFETITRKCS